MEFNFFPLNNEEVIKRFGSILLTNKRIVQIIGSGRKFEFNIIPINQVSQVSQMKSDKIVFLILSIVLLAAGGFIYNTDFYFKTIKFYVEISLVGLGLFLLWRYIRSRQSGLFIYSSSGKHIFINTIGVPSATSYEFSNAVSEVIGLTN